MSRSTTYFLGVRNDTLCRFLEDDYSTIRFTVNSPSVGYHMAKLEVSNPVVEQQYIIPDRRDGGRPISSSRREPLKKLTLTMHIQGTSPSDLSTKVHALLDEVKRYGAKLEYRPSGWAHSVVYTTYPWTSIDYSQWFKSAMQENDRLVDFKIEMDCEPTWEKAGAQSTLTVLESLGPDDKFSEWTAGYPVHWDWFPDTTATIAQVSVTSAGASSTGPRSGLYMAEIRPGVGGEHVALADKQFFAVDEDKPLNIQSWLLHTAGGSSVPVVVEVTFYDSQQMSISTIEIVDHNLGAANAWEDPCRLWGTSHGVIYPHTSSETIKFPAGTCYIHRRVNFTVESGQIVYVGAMYASQTELLTSDNVTGLMCINVPAGIVGGDRPAPMDIYINSVHQPATKIIIGESKIYTSGFQPIKTASDLTNSSTVGTLVQDPDRPDHYYIEYETKGNLIANDPGFNESSGTPTAWDHWDAYRVGHTSESLSRSTAAPLYEGAANVYAYGGYGFGAVNVRLAYKDYIAVDPDVSHYLCLMARGPRLDIGIGAEMLARTYLQLACYDDTPTLLGTITAWSGKVTIFSTFKPHFGYIQPVGGGGLCLPAGTTQVKPRVLNWGKNLIGQKAYWGYMMLCEANRISEVSYDLENHQGRYVPLAGVSADGAVIANDRLYLRARVMWTGEEAGGQIFIDESEARLGNPYPDFGDIFWGPKRFGEITFPNEATPEDVTGLEERLLIDTEPIFDGTKNIQQSYFAICPTDRAYIEITDIDAEHIIINCAAETPAVLMSKDGTLSSCKVLDPLSWKPPPRFEADPDGFNMVINASHEDDEGQGNWCINDIVFRWRDRYEIMADS